MSQSIPFVEGRYDLMSDLVADLLRRGVTLIATPGVDGRLRASVAAARTEHIGCPFLEQCLPRCDLIRVDVELLRQLSQSSIAQSDYGRVVGTPRRRREKLRESARRSFASAPCRLRRPIKKTNAPHIKVSIARRTNASV